MLKKLNLHSTFMCWEQNIAAKTTEAAGLLCSSWSENIWMYELVVHPNFFQNGSYRPAVRCKPYRVETKKERTISRQNMQRCKKSCYFGFTHKLPCSYWCCYTSYNIICTYSYRIYYLPVHIQLLNGVNLWRLRSKIFPAKFKIP